MLVMFATETPIKLDNWFKALMTSFGKAVMSPCKWWTSFNKLNTAITWEILVPLVKWLNKLKILLVPLEVPVPVGNKFNKLERSMQ